MMRIAPKLAKSVSMSAAQPILAHDGRRQFALPASDAWRRLQALHRGALLETRQGDAGIAPRRAQDAYAKSLGSVLGQFGSSHPALRDSMFESLLDHIDASGSMDGLESIYASGLTDVARRNKRLFERASRTTKSVGWPTVSGGGLEHGIHVDAAQRMISKLPGRQFSGDVAAKFRLPNDRTGTTVTVGGRQFTGALSGGSPSDIAGPDLTSNNRPNPSDVMGTELPDTHLSAAADPRKVGFAVAQ